MASRQCKKGHLLHAKVQSGVGAMMNKRHCVCCDIEIAKDASRYACKECKGYHICMSCADPSEGKVSVGSGPYVLRAIVPPERGSGDTMRVTTPDMHSIEVVIPAGTVSGCAFDVYYKSDVTVEPRRLAPSPKVLGYRWFVVLALMFAQILFARAGYIPWLPADEIIAEEPLTWYVLLLLVALSTLTTVPADTKGVGWVRFLSSTLQGFGFGQLLVFDKHTVFARLMFALALGTANGFDRLQAMEVLVAKMPMKPGEGCRGVLETEDAKHKVEVVEVEGETVKLRYIHKIRGKPSTENIALSDSRLQLEAPRRSALDRLMQWAKGGFQARPWGFSIGVTVSQWVSQGFNIYDYMGAHDIFLILGTPLEVALLWMMVQRSKSWQAYGICLTVLVLSLVLATLHFVPIAMSIAWFAATQIAVHSVVAYLAIFVDVIVVMYMLDPSTDDIVVWRFERIRKMVRKARESRNERLNRLAAEEAAASGGDRDLEDGSERQPLIHA
eukprot:TRINITY_DN19669_c0_g2_i1.p1 TRINITY_DN19669_c0_g2~~TRINITY_DN19669_c0_g2_i1.p1  ORF type:complete len:499 (-),score=72.10 TRINITY_DN19669_c0_g2_i1:71-1567(-)